MLQGAVAKGDTSLSPLYLDKEHDGPTLSASHNLLIVLSADLPKSTGVSPSVSACVGAADCTCPSLPRKSCFVSEVDIRLHVPLVKVAARSPLPGRRNYVFASTMRGFISGGILLAGSNHSRSGAITLTVTPRLRSD